MSKAARLLQRATDRAAGLFHNARKALGTGLSHMNDGAVLGIFRQRQKSGSIWADRIVRMGPNHVHAFITHRDGSVTDLGVSKNLLTNIGRDVFHSWIGGFIPTAQNAPATATSGTSLTGTSTTWTASNLATPQLGCATFRVYAPVTGLTTAPVYGNIISNSTSVLTIDKWWTAADGTGTTPASTNSFIIAPGGMASIRFMALTTDSGAASASDTVLASEITTAGAGRALATYAHTQGASTQTLQKAFSITSTLTAVHKMGLFCTLSAAGADPMVFETVLNADATVVNGDTLTCLSGDTKLRTRAGAVSLRDIVGERIEVLNRFGEWEKASVRSFGVQRLQRIEFGHLNPVYATAAHRWWQKDGTRVTTTDLKRVPFMEGGQAEVKAVLDTGRDEEVFCAVVPGSESFTLENGLVTSNCTDTITVSG